MRFKAKRRTVAACTRCHGGGSVGFPGKMCPDCGGSGNAPAIANGLATGYVPSWELEAIVPATTCLSCGGLGGSGPRACSRCGGTGAAS